MPWCATLTSPGLGIDCEVEPITTAERNLDGGVLEATPQLAAGGLPDATIRHEDLKLAGPSLGDRSS